MNGVRRDELKPMFLVRSRIVVAGDRERSNQPYVLGFVPKKVALKVRLNDRPIQTEGYIMGRGHVEAVLGTHTSSLGLRQR